ncbi:MAG: hypothetical protein JXA77_01825 [Bacteroidales bacterium]|nr:hypothetical protein [Bacteroidales bacterium]MBN2818903.1 hypothetical protein [Bacteroidales bacterium]
MNKIAVIIILFIFSVQLSSQTKLLIDDGAGILDPYSDSLLIKKLAESGIEYVSILDYKQKCGYHYATIFQKDNSIFINIADCHKNSLGVKNLGSSIVKQLPEEKSILLNYAIKDIIDNPAENVVLQEPEKEKTEIQENKQQEEFADTRLPVTKNQHITRYFFTPTAYSLEEGELYYNTLYFLIHDAQYGISNDFSFGMGTTVIGFPFYFTPKLTVFQNDKMAIALGDMMILGTYGTKFFGNLGYGVVTLGNEFKNFSIGIGSLFLSGEDFPRSNKPVVNLASMVRMSDYFYFVSENYYSAFKTAVYGEYWVSDPTGYEPFGYPELDYNDISEQNIHVLFGITGIRFINKTKDVVSFQVGLGYFGLIPGKEPTNYAGVSDAEFYPFPMVSLTKKFGLKY